jgi:hypothetical protein
MPNATMSLQTIDLGYDQLLVLREQRGLKVRVLYGGVWLTEEGEPTDRFLSGGEATQVGRDGATVIEALAPTRLELLRGSAPRTGWRWPLEAADRALQTVLRTALRAALRRPRTAASA